MHRVSPRGSYRLDRVYPPPVGRLAIATGATTKTAFGNVVACLNRLVERGHLRVLLALKMRRVTVSQVLDADRDDALPQLLADLDRKPEPEAQPFWPSVHTWLDSLDDGPTERRYRTSMTKLERIGIPGMDAESPISALADVPGTVWRRLQKEWPGSGSDFNHARRALSRYLNDTLGTYHDVWRALYERSPRRGRRKGSPRVPEATERKRVPELDVPTFWRVVNAAPEHVRASFVAIVALGLRVGEYLRLRPEHLHRLPTHAVAVPGTKTLGSTATMPVDSRLWPWIERAVPSAVQYKWLRVYWKKALAEAKADTGLRLHDLRHLPAQLLSAAGRPLPSIRLFMRHGADGAMSITERYAVQNDQYENAVALAAALLEQPETEKATPLGVEHEHKVSA